MKFAFFIALLFAMCELSAGQKIYLSPESLHICKHGIFLRTETQYLPVKALFSDEDGIYTYEEALVENGSACRQYGTPEAKV